MSEEEAEWKRCRREKYLRDAKASSKVGLLAIKCITDFDKIFWLFPFLS